MAATIEDIAEKAGVSPSTVSRVLRGDVKGAQHRSAKKSADILRIAKELDYHPSWRARSFSRGRTHSIGLLFSDPIWIFEDPMNQLAISFTESLKSHEYDLRLIPADSPGGWEQYVMGGAVDGLVLMQHTPQRAREAIERSGLPAVLLGERSDSLAPHVVPDDYGGAYSATKHLLGLGHKRIVFYVDTQIRPHHSVGDRLAGFETAVEEAGLSDQADSWTLSADEAIARLLEPDAPTAMLGYCHVEAFRIMHRMWTHGLKVPTDLSLISFNDTWLSEIASPPLSVIGFDTAEMGRRAAELLIEQIESPSQERPDNVVIPHKLTIRSTTAPPFERKDSQ